MKKQSFLQGALILMLAGLINRIIGFVLRMILVRMIGDEGVGLFQMIYPLFMTLLLFSTAGFPTAISKLIPEKLANNDRKGSYYLLRTSLITVGFLSIFFAALVYFTAPFIATKVFSDQRTYHIIIAIIPALLISPLAATLRGFFQGHHTMTPTATSQISEQIMRAIATLFLINLISHLGIKYQAASIGIGISIGELTGLLVLLTFFFNHLYQDKKKEKKVPGKKMGYWQSLKTIATLGVPITMGRIVNSLMMSGEAILIPRQLELGGIPVKEATALYGQLSGMVQQLIFLPTVVTIALTTSLIPNVSDAYARNNIKKIKNNYQDVIRITSYLGFPITVIFFTMGRDICQLLFSYPEAGEILATMAFASTFIYYLQVSHGMLSGLGKPQLALLNLTIGSALKLVGIFYLTQQPGLGIQGAAISISLGFILSAILNFITIGHYIGYNLNINQCFIKPLLSSVTIYFLYSQLTGLYYLGKWQPLLNILLLTAIYLLIMIVSRAITKKDLERFRPNRK